MKNHMEELSQEDTAGMMRFWYEEAVVEQKKELREFKKKAKTLNQLPHVEPVPLTIESVDEGLSQAKAIDKRPLKPSGDLPSPF